MGFEQRVIKGTVQSFDEFLQATDNLFAPDKLFNGLPGWKNRNANCSRSFGFIFWNVGRQIMVFNGWWTLPPKYKRAD